MDPADNYIDRLSNLPPAPTVATELLELFSNPNQDLDRIVELIRYDPSLTAKILKKCNTAHFSGEEPATDLFQVVMRLGFYEVYCVVAALVATSAFSIVKTEGGIDLNRLWRHSVVTAVVAGKIAKHLKEPPAVAFTAGLLHDIGKLIFASVESSAYTCVLQAQGDYGYELSRAEQAVFGVSHAGVGARLLARWELPEKIVVAVRHHHAASAESAPQLVAIVQLANRQAHALVAEPPQASAVFAGDDEAIHLPGLTVEAMPEILAQAQAELQRFQGFTMLSFDPKI